MISNLLGSASKATKVQLQVCYKFPKYVANKNADGWFARMAMTASQISSLEKKIYPLVCLIIITTVLAAVFVDPKAS